MCDALAFIIRRNEIRNDISYNGIIVIIVTCSTCALSVIRDPYSVSLSSATTLAILLYTMALNNARASALKYSVGYVIVTVDYSPIRDTPGSNAPLSRRGYIQDCAIVHTSIIHHACRGLCYPLLHCFAVISRFACARQKMIFFLRTEN